MIENKSVPFSSHPEIPGVRRWQRRLLGILALGGGATGLSVTVPHLLQQGQLAQFLISLLALAIYVWGVWCGLILLEARPDAIKHNRRYWLVQSPILLSSIIGGNIWGGAHVSLQLVVWPLGLNWSTAYGAGFNYYLWGSNQPLVIGVNVLALAIATWLGRIEQQATEAPHLEPAPLLTPEDPARPTE